MTNPIFSNEHKGCKRPEFNYLDLDYKICRRCVRVMKNGMFYWVKQTQRLSTYCKECYKDYRTTGKYYQKKKIKAFKKIQSKIECVRCGCNDIRLLEVNHKNGGGVKEMKKSKYGNVGLEVIYGNRKTDDLELLCRPCNSIHYLELKYGKLPMEVSWNG